MSTFDAQILWTVATLILSFSTLADDAPTSFLKQLNTFQTFHSGFQQTVYDAHGNKIQITTGEFKLQRPGQFRWETKTPFEQVILASKQKVWVYDIELEQAIIKDAQQALGKTPAMLLIGTSQNLTEHFIVKPLQAKKNQSWYLITPKQPEKASFRHLRIGFNNDTLSEMRLIDSLDNRVQIRFLNPRTKVTFNQTDFHLKLPKDVDVIH